MKIKENTAMMIIIIIMMERKRMTINCSCKLDK